MTQPEQDFWNAALDFRRASSETAWEAMQEAFGRMFGKYHEIKGPPQARPASKEQKDD